MAGYRKDPPLLPRLPDNQPNFHRQSENIHTRDAHDTPLSKQRRNTRITETPNEACYRKDSLNPKRHETEQSRETPLPNTRITTKAFHTPDKQLKHNNESNRPPAITPYTEKNNHQNDENTPQKNHRKTNETIYTDRENNTPNPPTEIVAV